MRNVETLIVGAGISGLAYASKTNENYLIIEKESSAGGLCRTFYVKDYVWDYAGHFFHFAKPQIKKIFESFMSPSDMVVCNKKTNINYNGDYVDYPFQMNIHQLPKKDFIDCLYDLFNKEEKSSYINFEDMLYGKFGKSITEKFLKPYNEKLYACNLYELDSNAMGRFFPYANKEQIIRNMRKSETKTYNDQFDYPVKGAQFFIDILLNHINKDRLLLNSTFESVDIDRKIAVVNGEKIKFDKLVNTIPLNQFIKLLPNNFDISDSLHCNKVLVFNLGFDKPAVDRQVHWTYVPMKDINFYRCGFYNNILGSEKLSMYIEIGYKENQKVNVEEQLSLTISNLRKLGIIKDHKLIAYNSLIINPGYVHITEKSIKDVSDVRQKLSLKNIFTLGRYGKWTYCSIEDCIVDSLNLVDGVYEC